MTVLVRAVNVARFSGVYRCLEKGKKHLDEHEERPIKHFLTKKKKERDPSFPRLCVLFLVFDQ